MTVAAGRADASLLLDVFHLYKSGTPFTALKQINGASLHVIHLNDYPQAADASTLNDGNRIYPGDGAAPLRQILRDLRDNGFRGHLFAGVVQPRLLGPPRRREPENGDGEDPRHGARGDGVAPPALRDSYDSAQTTATRRLMLWVAQVVSSCDTE